MTFKMEIVEWRFVEYKRSECLKRYSAFLSSICVFNGDVEKDVTKFGSKHSRDFYEKLSNKSRCNFF